MLGFLVFCGTDDRRMTDSQASDNADPWLSGQESAITTKTSPAYIAYIAFKDGILVRVRRDDILELNIMPYTCSF